MIRVILIKFLGIPPSGLALMSSSKWNLRWRFIPELNVRGFGMASGNNRSDCMIRSVSTTLVYCCSTARLLPNWLDQTDRSRSRLIPIPDLDPDPVSWTGVIGCSVMIYEVIGVIASPARKWLHSSHKVTGFPLGMIWVWNLFLRNWRKLGSSWVCRWVLRYWEHL